MSELKPDDDRVVVRLSPKAMGAVEEIARVLGVSVGEAVGRALGTELFLLRFAKGDDVIFIEDKHGRHREELTVQAGGDANQERKRS
jgi:hypothetical protein